MREEEVEVQEVPQVVEPPKDREAALMARMEKSMLRAAGAEEVERARLPKPREILMEEVGTRWRK